MRSTYPFGNFLKLFQVHIFALIRNLLLGIGIAKMPNCKSNG